MNKYFAYSNELGVEFFETEEEAIEWCKDEIQYYRKKAGTGEWSDVVDTICYGKIMAKSFERIINKEYSDYTLEKIDD